MKSTTNTPVPLLEEGALSGPAAWAEYLAFTSGTNETASLPHRIIVQIARQGEIGDADSCATVVCMLAAGRSIRHMLEKRMAPDGLSEARLFTLLTLYAMDPLSSTAADLAYHAEVKRGSMTRILDVLVKRGWVVREPSQEDRRSMPVSLTEDGRRATIEAVHHFIHLSSGLTGNLTLIERQRTISACERLKRHAVKIQKTRC